MIIREIQQKDNKETAIYIRAAFPEFDIPKVGTAYVDPETDAMFEAYQGEREVYFVIEVDGEVVGGAGIKQLRDTKDNVCELQKMYFLAKTRGKGYGKLLFTKNNERIYLTCENPAASNSLTSITISGHSGTILSWKYRTSTSSSWIPIQSSGTNFTGTTLTAAQISRRSDS